MQIHLEDKLLHQLEAIASHEQKDVNSLVAEAVERYIEELRADEALDSVIDEVMREQAWLLNELAKR